MSKNQSKNPLTIFTIGHSNSSAARIIELIEKYGISLFVDVRSTPYSRYNPQFNRETFAATLKGAGIAYQYLGANLGGWPKDPTCYFNGKIPRGGEASIKQVDYNAVMQRDFFQNGIHVLLDAAKRMTAALMCSEEDPRRCHRHHLIGIYLTQLGVNVLHIRADGNIIKDQDLTDSGSRSSPQQPKLF